MSVTKLLDPNAITATLLAPKERVLLCGVPTSGKTIGWLMMAQRDFQEAKRDGVEPVRYYVLDTESRVQSYMAEGEDFNHLWHENGGNVVIYPVRDFTEVRTVYRTIIAAVARDYKEQEQRPWFVIDSLTKLYEFCQHFAAGQKSVDLYEEAATRAIEKAGYGAFDTNGWQSVKQRMQSITDHTLTALEANVLFTTHLRELIEFHFQDAKAGSGKKERLAMFRSFGMHPQSPPWLDKDLSTIAVLVKDEKLGGSVKHSLAVVKDSGLDQRTDKDFDREWYQALRAIRDEQEPFDVNVLGK